MNAIPSNASITDRAVQGMYYRKLQELNATAWINRLALTLKTDQPNGENFNWFSATPQFREHVGSIQLNELTNDGIKIVPVDWESSLQFKKRDMRFDKTGQIRTRINELAVQTINFDHLKATQLIQDAEQYVCYDGSYFFDTDHTEGIVAPQSNKLTISLASVASAIGSSFTGGVSRPSADALSEIIAQLLEQAIGFKDDQGNSVNAYATAWDVMVPPRMMVNTLKAVSAPNLAQGTTNGLSTAGMRFNVVANPTLTWTNKLALFRADETVTKPIIKVVLEEPQLLPSIENGEFEVTSKRKFYSAQMASNMALGDWRSSVLAEIAA